MTQQPVPAPALGDRGLFPDLTIPVYLQHCAISPLPAPVVAAIRRMVELTARVGAAAFSAGEDAIERCRRQMARLLGASPDDVAFLPNTTSGVAAVAVCYPWRPGDRVVLFRGEFPANVVPWLAAARLHRIRPVWLSAGDFARNPDDGLDALDRALKRGARLVAVSAVQFQTGLAMPLRQMARLCRDRGARLFVDGIQAVGVLPLDVRDLGIDYLATGSHKWLMGPIGCGALYASPAAAADLEPRLAGWTSVESPYRFLHEGPGLLRYDRPIRRDIRFLEGGTLNAPGLAGLGAAIDIILAIGVERIAAHVSRYLDALEPVLTALGCESARAPYPAGRSGILAVRPPAGRSAAEVAQALRERGVACTPPDGYLRFAPHWPNALEEVSRVASACREVLGG